MYKPENPTVYAAGESRQLGGHVEHEDSRDILFKPADLADIPARSESCVANYQPVFDQGNESGSLGYALAAVAHYHRQRQGVASDVLSPHMINSVARRYPDSLGFIGCRSAMKAWNKHGICEMALWRDCEGLAHGRPAGFHADDSAAKSIAGYARIDRGSLSRLRSAIVECGAVLASAHVNPGWAFPGTDAMIASGGARLGLHTFAIVGYDEISFWIHNSWSTRWGRFGLARLSFGDWLRDGVSAWAPLAQSHVSAKGSNAAETWRTMRAHAININADGTLSDRGMFAASPDDIREIMYEDIPTATARWSIKRILTIILPQYAGTDSIASELAQRRDELLSHHIYPLFLLMQGQSSGSSVSPGGNACRLMQHFLGELHEHDPFVQVHVAASGVGATLMAEFLAHGERNSKKGRAEPGVLCLPRVVSCALWAPSMEAGAAGAYEQCLASGYLRRLYRGPAGAEGVKFSLRPGTHSCEDLARACRDAEVFGGSRMLSGERLFPEGIGHALAGAVFGGELESRPLTAEAAVS